ncbi:AraC family transcriptional regulator [Neptunomonas phycophila]|uniref:AraC family transcriptional regulator n=1 Tax=Neptunomonas phycophila TaxID=1572645 RepID=A0ABT9EUW4_9GAMM|nr:AraC family transcriptional regulator [Neptunomonas phycophila]MDP2522796.1 AraC family transcriptional regulator [Neptunomonas phycophila]
MYTEDPSHLYSEAQRIEILRQQMVAQLKIKLPATHTEENDALGVRIFRSDGPTAKTPGVYEPIVCFLLQGEKQISVGSQMIRYQPMQYLLVPVTLPASGRVIKASSDQPYLGMAFNIDIKTLSDLVIELGDKLPVGADQARGINIGDMDYSMVSAFYRLLSLMDESKDIPIMLPLLKREILYRLLMSEVGSQLRDFALLDSQTHRIVKVIDQLRQRFNEPLRIKELAELVHMSESALYQGFKAVTSMTPLQFQKQLRLNEARRIMLYDGIEASTASYKVGYESPSQFSREYSRLFGAPPKTDISRFRQSL